MKWIEIGRKKQNHFRSSDFSIFLWRRFGWFDVLHLPVWLDARRYKFICLYWLFSQILEAITPQPFPNYFQTFVSYPIMDYVWIHCTVCIPEYILFSFWKAIQVRLATCFIHKRFRFKQTESNRSSEAVCKFSETNMNYICPRCSTSIFGQYGNFDKTNCGHIFCSRHYGATRGCFVTR